MNSPNNIKEVITKIDQEMNQTSSDKKIEDTNTDNKNEYIVKKFDYCPLLTICYSFILYLCILYLSYH